VTGPSTDGEKGYTQVMAFHDDGFVESMLQMAAGRLDRPDDDSQVKSSVMYFMYDLLMGR
jgi:hypothetical protein